MDLPIYSNFQHFQNNYIKDFEYLNDIDFSEYLEYLNYQYSEIINLQNNIKGASINRIDELKRSYKDERILKYVILETLGIDKNKDKNSIEITYKNDEVRFLNYQLKREFRYYEISKAHTEILNFVKLEILKLNLETNKNNTNKKTKLSNPEKIAVLYEIGIETILNKVPIQEDKYRFIHELIGGNYDNVKKYMMNGLTNDNRLKAKDFINSKTI